MKKCSVKEDDRMNSEGQKKFFAEREGNPTYEK
jgi:hypothetical protein